ncbi:MAG: AMP-binding protein, partial [Candidatus Dadabacteria bacterium]|nr:AMP-binding protein [Candidatus Dadabacteria bacterium]
ISLNPMSKPKNTSVGMVIPSVDVKIVDPDSEGNGEIWARGDNIMKGYYKNDEATKEVLTEDGWLKTGDIGYFDEEGYLYITGRKKFVIVTKGGKNVYPEEVEEKLCKSLYIEEAMV